MADEPTSSLDDENSDLLLKMLCKVNRDAKVTVIVTTADLCGRFPPDSDYALMNGQILKSSLKLMHEW